MYGSADVSQGNSNKALRAQTWPLGSKEREGNPTSLCHRDERRHGGGTDGGIPKRAEVGGRGVSTREEEEAITRYDTRKSKRSRNAPLLVLLVMTGVVVGGVDTCLQ